MGKLRIALFGDGRPGHEKQSRGIVQALQRYLDVELTEHPLPRLTIIQEILSSFRYVLGYSSFCQFGEDLDLVIGSGSRTHIPVLSCARASRARSVVCMSPPWPLRNRFDLCCSPIHDRLRPADNLLLTIGPPNSAEVGRSHKPDSGLFCIGGRDPSSHTWDEDRIVADVRQVIQRSAIRSWIISSSPRTPARTETLLAAMAAEFSAVRFVPFSQTAPGWIETQYREHQTVWITADSISMVYEALSAGCRVGIVPVHWKKRDSKFRYSERYLIDKKLVVPLSAWLNNTGQWEDHEPLHEADRCAREILRRWWPKNLQ